MMISTRKLSKHFGDNVAVLGLDLDVHEGEVFGFLGPNGAGKTTTVRMLTCLIAPSEGEAWVAGQKLGENDDRIRAQVGILTESPGMYERLSARKNLELYARFYGVDNPAKNVDKYLQLLDLSARAGDEVATFSKGMKQKVAIARALVHEPTIVFLDEPTSGLDPEAAKVVREFIGSLRGQGRTIFLTTHNLDEADRLCDRVAIFKRRLIRVDTPEALRRSFYGDRVRIRLRAFAPEYLQVAQAVPGVRSVTVVDDALVVESDAAAECNPALVRGLVQAGADVQYVEEVLQSLEEAYLKLINAAETASATDTTPGPVKS